MTKDELTGLVTRLLEEDRDVDCAFGRITTRTYLAYMGRNPPPTPPPKKYLPFFTPSETLLAQALGKDGISHAELARTLPAGSVLVYNLYADRDPSEDELEIGDGKPAYEPLARPVETIDIGRLFEDAVAALRSVQRFEILGLGTLERRTLARRRLDLPRRVRVADAHLEGKSIVYMAWSQVLKNILNSRDLPT